ncbi:hypothetical protein LEMLEM_LOCUS6836, partial [Lemmus lemmus]
SAPGSTNLLQEEDGHRRGSLWSLSAIWARNCSCLDCLTGHKEPTERGLLDLPKGTGSCLCCTVGSCSHHQVHQLYNDRPSTDLSVLCCGQLVTSSGTSALQ